MTKKRTKRAYPTAEEDLKAARDVGAIPQTLSPSYRLAFADNDFLLRDELRPVRLQLELLKPELLLEEHGISSTVVVFGSARIPEPSTARALKDEAEAATREAPNDEQKVRAAAIARRMADNSRYYDIAREFAHRMSVAAQELGDHEYVVITGGGGGLMEAANRGAHDAGSKSIGLSIVLPREQRPNPFVTPTLSFQFHYFAIRKMHFLMRARALAIFPGGFGTLDELFDALTLIQTGKINPMPVLMFGAAYWRKVINFEAMVEEGTISPGDIDIISFVETAEEAWRKIEGFYSDRH